MPSNFTPLDLAVCGIAAMIVLVAIYMHTEGNRIRAIKFTYDDISREMGGHSRVKVWWRAFNIAMGWQTKRGAHSHRVTTRTGKAAHN